MIETFELINDEFPWFFSVMSTILGAITGSFLNVCIYRIPANCSVVVPGSTCGCGRPIPFYLNVPILSWIFLRGKANCCGENFSLRYPAIELLTAILFFWSWTLYSPIIALVGMLYISFLICATFIDFDHMIIPDRFSIGGMVLGVFFSTFFPELHQIEGAAIVSNIQSAITSIIGALVGAGLVYWIAVIGEVIFRKPAMGEGDVKFAGFIGAFCGWQGAVFAMFGGALIGSIMLLPFIVVARLSSGRIKTDKIEVSSKEKQVKEYVQFGARVPFGPMLAVAGLIYFLGANALVDAYFAEYSNYFFAP